MTPRIRISTALITLSLVILFAPVVFAAGTMTMTLQPHCTETDRTKCPFYTVKDAQFLETNKLNAGDILDVDVVVKGSDFAKVRYVRAWLDYDPEVLEARNVDMVTTALPSPIPGEQTVDANAKVVKIGGTTTTGFTTADTVVARVTFRVLKAQNSVIGFHSYTPDGLGNAYVNGEATNGAPNPLLSAEPSKLSVKLTDASSSSSVSSVMPTSSSLSSSMMSSISSSFPIQTSTGSTQSSVSSAPTGNSAFGLLQVQNVKVTTRGTMIFLGWQDLKSSGLAGYNVYYGTVSGRYIQRRSLPATATSLVLRDLEMDSTYYLAVRAVNQSDEESAFSQEVSVVVGKPETATSPLTNIPSVDTAPDNPATNSGGVKGETGLGSMMLWLVVGSAGLGTVLAFRRQMKLSAASY